MLDEHGWLWIAKFPSRSDEDDVGAWEGDRTDGAGADEGASYVELADVLISLGSNTSADLEQLWRRIDMNPNPHGEGLRSLSDNSSRRLAGGDRPSASLLKLRIVVGYQERMRRAFRVAEE